jgi:hypothetical protein
MSKACLKTFFHDDTQTPTLLMGMALSFDTHELDLSAQHAKP